MTRDADHVFQRDLELAPSSSRSVFETLSALLSAAVDDERIARNPAKGARLARVDKAPFVPMTEDEVRAVAHHAVDHVRAAVVVAAGTGLRQASCSDCAETGSTSCAASSVSTNSSGRHPRAVLC